MGISSESPVSSIIPTPEDTDANGRLNGWLIPGTDERQTLEEWARWSKSAQTIARPAWLVLACADGQKKPCGGGGRRWATGVTDEL